MRAHGFGLSDVGKERTNNEDSLLIDDSLGLYIVADGMGGHAAGEVASSNAVRIVSRALHENNLLEMTFEQEGDLEQAVGIVEEAVQLACRRIWEMATSGQGFAGMGTTLTLLLVAGTKGIMVHVGDSRIYMARGGKIHQLSDDHTFTAELVRNGVFTPEQAQKSPYAHVLTRALGKSEKVQVDTLVFDVLPGDTFLLCSDGLTTYLDGAEMIGYLGADDIRSLPRRFVDLALERGGEDNITTVVARMSTDEGLTLDQEMYCTRVQTQFDTLQRVSLLRQVSMAGLVQVLDISREVILYPGEHAIVEGELCTSLIIILEGSMSVIRQGALVTTLGAGHHAGDMSCLRQRPSTATLQAQTTSRCLIVHFESLQRLIRKDPRLGIQLLQNLGEALSDRLDSTTSRLLSAASSEDTLQGLPAALLTP